MLTSIEPTLPRKFIRDATYRPNIQQLLMNAKGKALEFMGNNNITQ
jgi:hypothetical protein